MKPQANGVRPLTFFVLTFALSWIVWIPLDLSHFGVDPFTALEESSGIVRLLGVIMPAVAAFTLAGIAHGRSGPVSLLRRMGRWRVGWRWWVAATLVFPVLLVAVGLGFNLFGASPTIAAPATGGMVAVLVNAFFLLVASFGEEIGWRGVALPSLQRRYTPILSSLILGVVWAVWHLPFWLLLDTYEEFGAIYLLLNVLFVVPGAFYITWFFNRTRSSLLLPVVFHVAFNLVNVLWLPVTLNIHAYAVLIGVECPITIFVLVRLAKGEAPHEEPIIPTKQSAPT